MIVIDIYGNRATLRGRDWECAEPLAKRLLDIDLEYFTTISGADPWPERTIAQGAVDRYGARIVLEVPPVLVPDAVY